MLYKGNCVGTMMGQGKVDGIKHWSSGLKHEEAAGYAGMLLERQVFVSSICNVTVSNVYVCRWGSIVI
jgi:hypothetical protein